ncbi:epidermal growth factor receptor kinase substrate 8-like protein 3 [Salminus brasiliensis]|uniref:epidermal growth factor receptor kinase substrate 8-like protein 3 n=1 Tax=Salminus brasiliensis TaxID=930266 RepID=UPI003B82D92E
MFESSSVFDFSSSSYTESLQSSGYSVDENASLASSLSRPSAKSIYMRRKEYAESINQQLNKFQYRVEHLLTCELGGELRGVSECVERLKLLEETGRLWGQDMQLELNNGNLLLTDLETKEELDCLALSRVLEVKAVMDSCVYNSLLTISVQDKVTSIFMFQSDTLKADYIQRDLERILQNKKNEGRDGNKNRGRPGPLIKKDSSSSARPPNRRERTPEPRKEEWNAPDYDESPAPSPSPSPPPPTTRHQPVYTISEPLTQSPAPRNTPKRTHSPPPAPAPYTETERNVDILNHLINDIEEISDRVTAVMPRVDRKKKKKKKQKAVQGLPSDDQFMICFQKIKMAFNLLGELNGQINDPSAADLAHCIFSVLELVVSVCEEDLPPSVIAPLLEPECVRFLSEEATSEEDQLWQSLGDAWNIPSTKWPEDDDKIPTFTPVFNDGWQPPEITHTQKEHTQKQQQHSQRSTRAQSTSSWQAPQPSSEELPLSTMCVLCDFRARNDRELSVKKGETVELLDMSKRWWKVRNGQGQEGFIPNNVVKSTENEEADSNPVLNRKSRPEDVKAWLEYKGFNKITVRCLGGLSGPMLLGMTRDELKIVCPEEGGRVFYQLQNVKSALAMAREVSPLI